jgi:hypothetical protein
MANKILNNIPMSDADRKLWAQEGWSVFVNGDNNLLEVMRIDDPENWEAEYGYKVPLLKDDRAAVRKAKKYLATKGYTVVRRLDGKK